MYGVSGSSVHGRCSTWAYGARVLCLTSWSHLRLSQTRWLSACACASLGVSPTIGASLPWLLPRAHPCSPLYARYAALSTPTIDTGITRSISISAACGSYALGRGQRKTQIIASWRQQIEHDGLPGPGPGGGGSGQRPSSCPLTQLPPHT